MGSVLTVDEILGSQDLAVEEVRVEWRGKDGEPGIVRLRQLNAEESMALTEEMDLPENKGDGMYLMLIRCAIDAEGNPLFTKEDIAKLRKKSFRVLNQLQQVALQLNSMTQFSEVSLKNG